MISNRYKLISTLIIPLFFSIQYANASLLSIHFPAKGATVPPGPLTVTGGAIQSNSTLKDCNVQLKTDGNSFLNVTGAGKNNFTTWSTISNETTPGANQIEAQLKCIKPDGSYLIKHNVHNFTVSAPQNESAPVPKNNSGAPIHANLTNQLVPSNFKNPTGNFSRPIQNDLTNITGVPPPIHKDNVTTASVQKSTTIPTPPVNKTKVPETVSTAKPDGLPIVNMPHVTGHHKTIHIHFSH